MYGHAIRHSAMVGAHFRLPLVGHVSKLQQVAPTWCWLRLLQAQLHSGLLKSTCVT